MSRKIDFELTPIVLQLFPNAKEILSMPPMKGKEREHAQAVEMIRSFCKTDFSVPIDMENVCGHRGPGINMKDGYCPECYISEHIEETKLYVEWSKKYGPLRAAQMIKERFPEPSSSSSSSSKPTSSNEKKPSGQK